jgi:hypothetical protein
MQKQKGAWSHPAERNLIRAARASRASGRVLARAGAIPYSFGPPMTNGRFPAGCEGTMKALVLLFVIFCFDARAFAEPPAETYTLREGAIICSDKQSYEVMMLPGNLGNENTLESLGCSKWAKGTKVTLARERGGMTAGVVEVIVQGQHGWTSLSNLVAGEQSEDTSPTDLRVVDGTCDTRSHIAEGPVGSDLTKARKSFTCNSAVIAFLDNRNEHVMVQFGEKQSKTSALLGFAGWMSKDGDTLRLDHVYLPNSAAPQLVDDGTCKFFFKDQHMSGIFCGAKTDKQGERIVESVIFNAAPGQ